MKFSKRAQILFSMVVVISLLTFSIFVAANNSFVKIQPPTEGEWVISSDETIIDDDIIINGSISIQFGSSLTIINSNVTFLANKTHSFELKVDGELYVENSNLTVTNSLYNFSLSGDPGSIVEIIDSKIEYCFLSFINAEINIEGTTFNGCYELTYDYMDAMVFSNNIIQHGTVGLVVKRTDTVLITENIFLDLDFGLDVGDAFSGTISNNEFTDSSEGIITDSNVELNITWNTFNSVQTGLYVDDTAVNLLYNSFVGNELALVLDDGDGSTVQYNNFTDCTDTCLYSEATRDTIISLNRFIDGARGIETTTSRINIEQNIFDNLSEAIIGLESDIVNIKTNNFTNIRTIGIRFTDSWDNVITNNHFSNLPVGINIIGVRRGIIQGNTLTNVDEGIGIISSRETELLGNTIENTITGMYLEQSKDTVVTANGAINATYGITLWSMSNALLASNGVFDSIYGISIWFSENVRAVGNEISTSDIGIIARRSTGLVISNGIYNFLDYGVQIIGCTTPKIFGNSFTNITNEALIIKDSNDFIVYHNNFGMNLGIIADIINCLGVFNYIVDEIMTGNYFVDNPSGNPVFIDTVGSVDIYDNYPLTTPYQVKPTIEFISRDISQPTDQDEVEIETQIFVPEGTDVTVYLQYTINYIEEWNNLDITSSVTPVGSIGAINQYFGLIPIYPYNYVIKYRIAVEFNDGPLTILIATENDTYTINPSDSTPIIIHTPELYYITLNEDGDEVIQTSGNNFYEGIEYFVAVEIDNNTDISLFEGNRYVNITWSEFDPFTNESVGFSATMDYNSTTDEYTFEFGRIYDAGYIIDFYISVIDINGTLHRTVFNTTLEFTLPPEATGFDIITLLSIGGTLVIVQAIVVIRRRRRKEE